MPRNKKTTVTMTENEQKLIKDGAKELNLSINELFIRSAILMITKNS